MRNETHIRLKVLHQLVQRSRFFWQGIGKTSAFWKEERQEGCFLASLLMS